MTIEGFKPQHYQLNIDKKPASKSVDNTKIIGDTNQIDLVPEQIVFTHNVNPNIETPLLSIKLSAPPIPDQIVSAWIDDEDLTRQVDNYRNSLSSTHFPDTDPTTTAVAGDLYENDGNNINKLLDRFSGVGALAYGFSSIVNPVATDYTHSALYAGAEYNVNYGNDEIVYDDVKVDNEKTVRVRTEFSDYVKTHGGIAMQGLPVTNEFQELSPTDGKIYTVQYFERAVFELHEENDSKNRIQLSLLGTESMKAKHGDENGSFKDFDPAVPVSNPNKDGVHFFAPTGHTMEGIFYKAWNENGGLAQFGYPITQVFKEKLRDGNEYEVQYTQRNRIEKHIDKETGKEFYLFGTLGADKVKTRYPQGLDTKTWIPKPESAKPTETKPPEPTYKERIEGHGVPLVLDQSIGDVYLGDVTQNGQEINQIGGYSIIEALRQASAIEKGIDISQIPEGAIEMTFGKMAGENMGYNTGIIKGNTEKVDDIIVKVGAPPTGAAGYRAEGLAGVYVYPEKYTKDGVEKTRAVLLVEKAPVSKRNLIDAVYGWGTVLSASLKASKEGFSKIIDFKTAQSRGGMGEFPQMVGQLWTDSWLCLANEDKIK